MLEIDVSIGFPGFALQVSASWPADDAVALFGPSGAGKSTLLRIAAGLESRSRGVIRFSGECWQDSRSRSFVPSCERGAVLVFQDSRLFPHLNVTENLKFGMKRRRGRRGPDWNLVRTTLQLDPLLERRTGTLSGGERQRVALGRALLAAPRLLLLDEPMSALDAARRDELLPELGALLRRFGIPAVFVSHSADELRMLASDAFEMSQGRIISRRWPAGPGCVLGIPVTATGRVRSGLSECRLGSDTLFVDSADPAESGDELHVGFDPQHTVLARRKTADVHSFGQITAELRSDKRGPGRRCRILRLRTGGAEVTMRLSDPASVPQSLTAGQTVCIILTRPAFASRPARASAGIADSGGAQ